MQSSRQLSRLSLHDPRWKLADAPRKHCARHQSHGIRWSDTFLSFQLWSLGRTAARLAPRLLSAARTISRAGLERRPPTFWHFSFGATARAKRDHRSVTDSKR